MTNHIIIYSHGFGVRKDDRGLFTDIAAALPDAYHVMFDYNHIDEAANTITVAALDTQAKLLLEVIADTRAKNPSAIIDLICHSQGCVVAALACPKSIRKVIFTAPPAKVLDTEHKIRQVCEQYSIAFTKNETVRLPRKDGSTTIIPPDYWRVRDNLDAQDMYNLLAEQTELTIVTATKDEVLGEVILDRLSPKVAIIEMTTGHNFEDTSRQELIAVIQKELGND